MTEPDDDTAEPVAPPPPAVADVVAALRRAMRRAARTRQPGLVVSVAQLELLTLVQERPGSRPRDLADALRVAPNSVSTLAQALVSSGMLRRTQDGADRRVVQLWLTAPGLATVRQWRETNEGLLATAMSRLDDADRRLLALALPALQRLVASIDEPDGR